MAHVVNLDAERMPTLAGLVMGVENTSNPAVNSADVRQVGQENQLGISRLLLVAEATFGALAKEVAVVDTTDEDLQPGEVITTQETTKVPVHIETEQVGTIRLRRTLIGDLDTSADGALYASYDILVGTPFEPVARELGILEREKAGESNQDLAFEDGFTYAESGVVQRRLAAPDVDAGSVFALAAEEYSLILGAMRQDQ